MLQSSPRQPDSQLFCFSFYKTKTSESTYRKRHIRGRGALAVRKLLGATHWETVVGDVLLGPE